ncbi:MAG: hypothetical protein QM805_16315 [Pseudomonas sp.]
MQTLQVYTCRSINSLLLLRGEGFQETHAAQLKKDLATLDSAVKAYAKADDVLRKAHTEFVTQIRNGVSWPRPQGRRPALALQPGNLSGHRASCCTRSSAPFPSPPHANHIPAVDIVRCASNSTIHTLGRAYISGLELAREQPQESTSARTKARRCCCSPSASTSCPTAMPPRSCDPSGVPEQGAAGHEQQEHSRQRFRSALVRSSSIAMPVLSPASSC